ncbi:prolipoprotein diacylglyceryl transferase [Nonomuraea insulae]|uniref:Phosphatidylglycerol--prolipoprotein diacylglyceryl transferase n=1 Tax=Nonomuraea insulae TaxID=1616787 RepID=A0ABW1D1D6_9ACTN
MPLASIPSPSQGVWYLGIIPIRAYALCIVLGVIVAVWLSERRWRARGGQQGTIIDIAVPAVIFGLIGGRLYHVITDWQTYFGSRAIKEPYQALFIWEGGLGIWGAVALGAVGVWWSVRKRGLSMSAVADTVAPGIAFAQAIGRWGNWFNQELYGSPTTLPWGLEIDADHGGEPGVLYHPTFLYESLWDVALGFVLIFAGRRFALHHGRLFALYVAGYTLGRFWIEGLRIDPVGGVDHAVTFFSLRINQWTSIVLFIGALVYFWATRNKTGEEIVVPPSDGEPGAEAVDPEHSSGQADPDTGESTETSEVSEASGASEIAKEPPGTDGDGVEVEKPEAEEQRADDPKATDSDDREAATDSGDSQAATDPGDPQDAADPGDPQGAADPGDSAEEAPKAAEKARDSAEEAPEATEEGDRTDPSDPEPVTKEKNSR